MAKIKSMSPETRKFALEHGIIREGDNLRARFFESFEWLIKTLILVNSGGIVTILAHIDNMPVVTLEFDLSLFFFCLGLSFLLFLIIYVYFHFEKQLRQFGEDAFHFQAGTLDFDEIDVFKKKEKQSWVFNFSLMSSTIVFILGLLLAICAYFDIPVISSGVL